MQDLQIDKFKTVTGPVAKPVSVKNPVTPMQQSLAGKFLQDSIISGSNANYYAKRSNAFAVRRVRD